LEESGSRNFGDLGVTFDANPNEGSRSTRLLPGFRAWKPVRREDRVVHNEPVDCPFPPLRSPLALDEKS